MLKVPEDILFFPRILENVDMSTHWFDHLAFAVATVILANQEHTLALEKQLVESHSSPEMVAYSGGRGRRIKF